MATDPDRQSDGRPLRRRRRRALSEPLLGVHAAFQIGWAVAIAIPVFARTGQLVHRPAAGPALAIIELTAIWAVLAGIAWGLRVCALVSFGGWGARTRERVRDAGRRRAIER